MIPKKPIRTEEDFIKAAKADRPLSDLDSVLEEKLKVFPLRMPRGLHRLAKERAEAERTSLHDFILITIKDKLVS